MRHPTAIIDPSAVLHDSVTVGPYSVIGPRVHIGEGTVIDSHVCIGEATQIGRHNRCLSFSSIGGVPQSHTLEPIGECALHIGDHNVIHEYCTLNRGTKSGGHITRLGHHNLLMAYTHIAHDCQVGSHAVFVNHATLGGHVIVEDHVVLSAFVAVRQYCHIGCHAFVTRASKLTKDVLAYTVVQGNPPKLAGINRVGLLRRHFEPAVIKQMEQVYKIIFTQGLSVDESIHAIRELGVSGEWLTPLLNQLVNSKRGLVR